MLTLVWGRRRALPNQRGLTEDAHVLCKQCLHRATNCLFERLTNSQLSSIMNDSSASEKSVFQVERMKIVRRVHDWHIRVTQNLKVDVEVEHVKMQWTRLLDLDMEINNQELPIDAKEIYDKFKVVVAGIEKMKMRLPRQQQPSAVAPASTNTQHFSAETVSSLKKKEAELIKCLAGIEKRLTKGSAVDRKILFAKMNGYLAITSMLGQMDGARVDSVLTKVSLSNDDVQLIAKKHLVLDQHLRSTSEHLFENIGSKNVIWEQVFTHKQRPMLMVDGFLFYKAESHETKKILITYFKCIRSTRGKIACKVRVRIHGTINDSSTVTFTNGDEHNHPEDWFEAKQYGFSSSVRRMAIDSKKDPTKIQSTAGRENGLTPEDYGNMALIDTLKKRVHYYKNMFGIRRRVTSLRKAAFTEEETKTHTGEEFLMYDSRKDEDIEVRKLPVIMIWATEDNLDILRHCPHWSGDGTFSRCPTVSGQMYTVHCTKYPALPMIYALLPNMETDTYLRFFKQVLHLVGMSPKSIIIDFEAAVRNAVRKVFSGVEVSGCNFHFKQAINRNARKHLKKTYFTSKRAAIYYLHYLSYFPAAAISKSYKILKDNDEFASLPKEMLAYMERVWVGHINSKGKWVNPLYSPDMWSIFESFNDPQKNATTSVLEAFHRGFASWVECSPRLYDFIDHLKEQQWISECRIEQSTMRELGKY